MLSFKALFQGVQRHVAFEHIIARTYSLTNDINVHTACLFYIASAGATTAVCGGKAFIKT